MRVFLFLSMIMFSFVVQAFADGDSYYDTRNGRRYLCTFVGEAGCRQDSDCSSSEICRSGRCEPNPSGAVDCVDKAYSGTPFSRDEAAQVCQGSYSTAPAECAIAAYAGPLSKADSITLCQRTTNAEGPLACYNKAYAGPFSASESLSLCRGASSTAPADCAIKAYAGPYSKEEALRMCSARERSMEQKQEKNSAVKDLKQMVNSEIQKMVK